VQLLLQPFFQMLNTQFGVTPEPISLPGSLINFCGLPTEGSEFVCMRGTEQKTDTSLATMLKVNPIQYMILFFEACSSGDWTRKFCMVSLKYQDFQHVCTLNELLSTIATAKSLAGVTDQRFPKISRAAIRNLFLKVGPYALCSVLSFSVEEEQYRLLVDLPTHLSTIGLLSTAELLSPYEDKPDVNGFILQELKYEGELYRILFSVTAF
jgi:hypothetical protein